MNSYIKTITLLTIFVFFLNSALKAQQRILNAQYITEKPKIDGLLTEKFWTEIYSETNFIQYEPYNGQKSTQKTNVKFAYGENAIYIAAICKTDNEIYNILTKRDDFGQSDYFGFYLDPYNTGLSGYGFFVTAAGVQVDIKVDNYNQNFDWDAVWYSNVTKIDSFYVVEMRIPYSAFRFPKKNSQDWSINFYRNIQQVRELSTWNYVDNSKNGIVNQMGTVKNLKNIKPVI
ncbi:MAG: carbohydrate binding family 9 domain-containing protein, partial [Bacteroidota bacterium]|nr:carbohydrate binding family 9 domain-containing protein [Bacteroidota bacterium]